MTIWKWSVSFEMATIARGTAETRAAAVNAAAVAETTLICKGINPDSLAWHVSEVQS